MGPPDGMYSPAGPRAHALRRLRVHPQSPVGGPTSTRGRRRGRRSQVWSRPCGTDLFVNEYGIRFCDESGAGGEAPAGDAPAEAPAK